MQKEADSVVVVAFWFWIFDSVCCEMRQDFQLDLIAGVQALLAIVV